jgi:hypothetical protein
VQRTKGIKGKSFGKSYRKPCAEEKDVNFFIDPTLDEVVKIRKGDHYIQADESFGIGSCLDEFFSQRPVVGLVEIRVGIRLELAYSSGGDNADAAGICGTLVSRFPIRSVGIFLKLV